MTTSDVFTTDAIIKANLNSDENACEKVTPPPPPFKDKMDSSEKFLIFQNTSEKTFCELNTIHNAVFNTPPQSAHQTKIKNIF